MLKTVVATSLAGTLALAAIAAQGPPSAKLDDATEKALIANERALYGAVAKADQATFQSLVLPEGIWTTLTGFVPMGPLSGGLSEFEVPKWKVESPHVVWTDGNAALLLYTRTGGGSFGGRTFPEIMLASTLWVRRGGQWLAAHHQESDLRQ